MKINRNLARAAIAVLLTTTLSACGGGGTGSEVGDNNIISTPESGGPAVSPDLTKEEAISAITPEGAGKLYSGSRSASQFLDLLLDQTSNDVIVAFVSESASTDTLAQKQVAYARTKSRVAAAMASPDYEVIDDYTSLPMSFVRLKSRRALVDFLNNIDVELVGENEMYTVGSQGR
jgi:hypothetical protein